LVEAPLTDDERAAVENDGDAVDHLIDLLADTPTPAGPTPRQLQHTHQATAPDSIPATITAPDRDAAVKGGRIRGA